MRKIVLNFVIDTLALVLAVLLVLPFVTGLNLHEWGALILVVLIVVHLCLHVGWYFSSGKEILEKKASGKVKLAYGVDILIFVAIIVAAVSGLMVSAYVMPTLGLFGPSYHMWQPVHAVSAQVLLALVIVHFVLHLHWYYTTFKSMRGSKGSGGSEDGLQS